MFVNKVNEFFEETNDLTKVLMLAVEYCVSHSILEDFLKKYTREVTDMFTQEYDFDLHLEARFNDGRDEERKNTIRILAELGHSPDIISQKLGIPESRVLEELARAQERAPV